jgi:competence protein ComEC
MRLVATGAIVVLLFRPEALAGASFQMSFAAVTAIVALHSSPTMRRLFERRDEGLLSRLIRGLSATLLTGLAVELVMIPLALFHFHRTGLYGVAANIIGIPLTTFVIMPAEAAALVLDSLGAGKPLWVVTSLALDALLGIAHWVGSARGAVAMLPSMPGWAFGLMVAGGLWLCLWNGRVRLLGLAPALLGAVGAASASTPDLLVTGYGRHLAIVAPDGVPMLLRERSGDYIQTVMAEAAAFDGEPAFLGTRPASHCSRDSCVVEIGQGAQRLRLLAIRSAQRIDWTSLTRACAQADIAVADRRLPRGCTPRWLKLDRRALEQTGGVAIFLGDPPRVDTVADRVGAHPWAM